MVDFTGMAKIMVAQEAPRTCLIQILSLMRGKGTLGTYPVSRKDLSKGILQVDGGFADFPLSCAGERELSALSHLQAQELGWVKSRIKSESAVG